MYFYFQQWAWTCLRVFLKDYFQNDVIGPKSCSIKVLSLTVKQVDWPSDFLLVDSFKKYVREKFNFVSLKVSYMEIVQRT